ncbi:hypothetical protein R3P38DRAFT_2585528 [Favolaschia claudopus]|uniref:Uncharacterized protein n=1 Tax=Favolaschia claudopus TaxID=2862362 RepID=A0AAV9Z650_9AGAR
MQCDNILAEHPDWARGPYRLRLPVWQDTAGDVSAKIDHISPSSWQGDVSVAKVSCKTAWFAGREQAEIELRQADWEPPFDSVEKTGGFSIFCPFGNNETVLLGRKRTDERDEDEQDRDIPSQPLDSPENPSAPANSDSDTPFLPDLDDVAQEAVVNLQSSANLKPTEPYLSISSSGSTVKQHKSTILRVFSSRFSVAESRDRLKRVRGYSRHTDSAVGATKSDDFIAGEPMILVQDPAAILVRSEGFMWLALATISSILCGTRQVETLPKRLLAEPNVRAKVQIMDLELLQDPPAQGSDYGDWEWTGNFVGLSASGISKICEVNGSNIQLLNPAVLPSRISAKNGTTTYHFKSVELVAIAASMELSVGRSDKLLEVAFTSSFPYRTRGGALSIILFYLTIDVDSGM